MPPVSPCSFLKPFRRNPTQPRAAATRKRELCVCELTSVLKETQPKISRHLALLRENGLLTDRRDGKWIHYRLSPHMPAWAAAVIEQAYLCQRDDIRQLSRQAERDNATTNGKPVCI